jgi:two-component system, OmpR family, sensor histidine kinase VanS
VDRAPGLSVRLKLTLSYAGFLMLAGALLIAAGWMFLSRTRHVGLVFEPGYRYAVVREAAPTAAIALAFLLVFGLLGGWILAGRMLAPLTRITDATRLAAAGSLAHRIRLPGRRDEFRELADAFDTMLARLEAHIAEQQRFAANASHELRTPLAITKTLLDVASIDPARGTGELIERLHAVNARAIDLTEALLLLSRADQRSFTREPLDLSLLVEEAAETLLPLTEKHGVTIQASGDITPTIGSRALLLQLTTNLVHNAIVHNLPGQGTVWVSTGVRPKGVTLTVENTGEKLSSRLVSTLTEPFQRGTERIRADHAGVGLGLAIVKSITQAHDGTLTIAPRAGGGLRVTVQLPATPTHTGRSRYSSALLAAVGVRVPDSGVRRRAGRQPGSTVHPCEGEQAPCFVGQPAPRKMRSGVTASVCRDAHAIVASASVPIPPSSAIMASAARRWANRSGYVSDHRSSSHHWFGVRCVQPRIARIIRSKVSATWKLCRPPAG